MTDIFDFTEDIHSLELETEDGCYREPYIAYFQQFMRTVDDVFVDYPTLGDAA